LKCSEGRVLDLVRDRTSPVRRSDIILNDVHLEMSKLKGRPNLHEHVKKVETLLVLSYKATVFSDGSTKNSGNGIGERAIMGGSGEGSAASMLQKGGKDKTSSQKK